MMADVSSEETSWSVVKNFARAMTCTMFRATGARANWYLVHSISLDKTAVTGDVPVKLSFRYELGDRLPMCVSVFRDLETRLTYRRV